MLLDYQLNATGVRLRVKLRDATSASGAGLTGLTSASSGLVIAAVADSEAATTAYTAAGSTIDTITTLGTYAAPTASHCRFKEVDSTNHKGVYEIQLENSRFAVANANSLLISFSGATNLAQCDVVIPLRGFNPYGTPIANVTQWNGHAVPAENVSGVPKVDVVDVNGSTVNPAATVTVGGYAAGQDPGTLVSAITVAGQTLVNAIRHIGATATGKISGAGTGTEIFSDFAGVACVTVTVDASGNRTAVSYA